MIEFKDTNHCISWTSKRKKFVFKYSGFKSIVFKYFKCVDCDLLYSSPQPIINIDSLNEIYNGEYYNNYFGRDNDYTVEKSKTIEIINQRLSKEFKYFSSFLDQLDDNKKVLDIGCGDERFLEFFEKIDWNFFGIKPSKFVAKIASKRKISILQKSVL